MLRVVNTQNETVTINNSSISSFSGKLQHERYIMRQKHTDTRFHCGSAAVTYNTEFSCLLLHADQWKTCSATDQRSMMISPLRCPCHSSSVSHTTPSPNCTVPQQHAWFISHKMCSTDIKYAASTYSSQKQCGQ